MLFVNKHSDEGLLCIFNHLSASEGKKKKRTLFLRQSLLFSLIYHGVRLYFRPKGDVLIGFFFFFFIPRCNLPSEAVFKIGSKQLWEVSWEPLPCLWLAKSKTLYGSALLGKFKKVETREQLKPLRHQTESRVCFSYRLLLTISY